MAANRGRFYLYCMLLLMVSCANIANAGAWLPKKGENQLIVSVLPMDNENTFEVETYYEHAKSDKLAFIIEQSYSIRQDENRIGEGLLAVRQLNYKRGNWVVSSQVGLVFRNLSDFDFSNTGYEMRTLIGRGSEKGWVNGEIAFRNCGAQHSMRWEGTFGANIRRNDKFILKAFGENDGCARDIHRAQISYIKSIRPNLGIEFGYRNPIGRDKNLAPSSFVIGLWSKF